MNALRAVLTELAAVVLMCVHEARCQNTTPGSNWVMATALAPWGNRTLHDCASFKGKIWLIGGYELGNMRADIWSSSDGTNWGRITDNAPWGPLSGHRLLVFSNMLWLVGGTNPSEYKNHVWNSVDGTNWRLVAANASWSGREGFGALVYDNRMWVMGGYGSHGHDVWSSADGIQWTLVTDNAPWGARARFQCVCHKGKMWVLGSEMGMTLSDDVWSSTDGTNWVQEVEHAPWGLRGQFTTLSDGTVIWVMGGYTYYGTTNDVWRSFDGVMWELQTSMAAWSPRSSYGTVFYQNAIWIIGGGADVWYCKIIDHNVAVTTGTRTVSYDVTAASVAGTSSNCLGMLWASNAVNNHVVSFPATTDWVSPPINLGVGANQIVVYATNAYRAVTSDSTSIVRGGVGTGMPYVDITNVPPAPLSYDVLYFVLGITNNLHVAGLLGWTNALTGTGGGFSGNQATVPLGVGTNQITVAVTNQWNVTATDSILVVRGAIGTGTPYVYITNQQPDMLSYYSTTYSLGGTNNPHVQGGMWWSNATTSAAGTISRHHPAWSCVVTGLAEGTNIIHVCASNYWSVIGTDVIMIQRGFEHDLPLLDPLTNVTVREHQVLRRHVQGRANVDAIACLADGMDARAHFDTNSWLFSCVPGLGTAGQLWKIAFIGINAFGMETQVLNIAIAPPAKGVGPKKPYLFEDEDGDLLDIKYSGVKKAGSILSFDGSTITITNAEASGTFAFKIKRNKDHGDASFTLRELNMDESAKKISLAGNVENIVMPEHEVKALKVSGQESYLSNAILGCAGVISIGKGSIIGTIDVSNGFQSMKVHVVDGGRIFTGVPPTADVTNTHATAGFSTMKVNRMVNVIVAGSDKVTRHKINEPRIVVKEATNSFFIHTMYNNSIEVRAIQAKQ